ncbi:hypothetical protein MMC29_000506 [Sticta canariensis]|nr:hypothetical protein [Sticta canariensis]
MTSLKRLSLNQLKHWRPKAGGESKGFFTEGTQDKMPGALFNESPPPPGHKRQWESWELPCLSALQLLRQADGSVYPVAVNFEKQNA